MKKSLSEIKILSIVRSVISNVTHKFKKTILTLTMILTMGIICQVSESSYISVDDVLDNAEKASEHRKFLKLCEYDRHFESLVDTLKWHEGYRAYPYYCLANVKTVGYGHAIKKGEHFNYPLSKLQADSLLRSDLNKSIEFVKRTTDLEHLQLLAMGHFVYALGSGNFQGSTLFQLIQNDQPINEEIIKWIHIKTKTGRIIRSKHLERSRIMELNLYNNENFFDPIT